MTLSFAYQSELTAGLSWNDSGSVSRVEVVGHAATCSDLHMLHRALKHSVHTSR